MSLFGGITPQARSRNLVEFKAGKMNLRGNMVYPDKRKGLLYVYQGNDLLMHLCWKDRSSNTAEEDLVIFPDEIEFKKVTQNTTGRVYILKWKNNARKFFFWMQEPKDDKDEEFCKKVNDFLNHPPSPSFGDDGSGSGGNNLLQPLMERMAGGGAGGIDPNDLSNVLGSMNPREFASLLSSLGGGGGAAGLMQGLHRTSGGSSGSSNQHTADSRPNTAPASTHSGVTTSTSTSRSGAGTSSKPRNAGTSSSSSSATAAPKNTAASTTSSGAKSSPIQIGVLTSVLANLSSSTTDTPASAGATSQSTIDLSDVMTHENLIPLLSNKDVQEKMRAHLPEDTTLLTTEKELKDAIQSPQFRKIVTAFSAAIQARELGSVLVQFALPDEVLQAANQGDLQAFAQALEKHYKKSTEEKPSDTSMDTS